MSAVTKLSLTNLENFFLATTRKISTMQHIAQWLYKEKPCDWSDNKTHLLRQVPWDAQVSVGKVHTGSLCFWLGLLHIHRTNKTSVLEVLTKITKVFSSWVKLIYLSQCDKWTLLLKKRKIIWGHFQHHKKALPSLRYSSDLSFLMKRCFFFLMVIVLLEKLIFSSQSKFY